VAVAVTVTVTVTVVLYPGGQLTLVGSN
jgi:hypothetical protein